MINTLKLNKILMPCILLLPLVFLFSQDEDYEYIDEDTCVDCHEESVHGTDIEMDLSRVSSKTYNVLI